MPADIVINITLNIASLLFLLMVGTATLWSRFQNVRFRIFTFVIWTHFLSTSSSLIGDLSFFLSNESWTIFAASSAAAVLDLLSVGAYIWLVFSDRDGKIRFKNRQQHLSVSLLCMAVFPPLFAVMAEVYLIQVVILEFAYTLSLQMTYYWLLYNREHRLSEREERITSQQAKVLAEQMQPHFIFNSLSSIEALCQIDPDLAMESIENFSGYLRGHIDALVSEDLIPFEQELEHIQQFVALEQADPSRQFTIEYDLATTDFRIPALSVQPIVENAIQHGALANRDGTGHVTLKTEPAGEFIRIQVLDNGPGETGLTEKQKEHISVGLKNATARIHARGGTLNFTKTEQGGRAVYLLPKEGK